jgi:hypothetical protein
MSAPLIEFAALTTALLGLGAVVAEILIKEPRLFAEIAGGIEKMAEPTRQPMRFTAVETAAPLDGAPANSNLGRQAA